VIAAGDGVAQGEESFLRTTLELIDDVSIGPYGVHC
jgi:hypothetical protein